MSARRFIACSAAGAMLSGCALLGPSTLEEGGPGVMRVGAASPAAAQSAIVAGSTRDQVIAVLGRANVIHFDSGWEVWVYRWPGADRSTAGAAELVVLLDPQGVVKKWRMRAGSRP